MSAVLATPPFIEFMDANGNPLAGGLIYTYAAGTLVPKATFTDATGLIPMSNPIVLDSAGRNVWFINGSYKYIVKDALGNTIRTVDNVISFSTLADAAQAFFQSFSGNNSQTVFTLSSDLGTDSKNLMVFLNKGLEQCISNGNFATDTIWAKGAGWTIGAGVATAAGAISTAISQSSIVTLIPGQAYAVTYTITRSAGGLIPSIGGQAGTERTASGTYREVIVAGSSQTIAFTGNAFTGTLDDVSVTVADTAGYDILNPAVYTVNGTSLTFATAPATGTNNIYVFAPSLLLGAASAAAALAQGYATAAAASASTASAAAALVTNLIKWKPAVACATTANISLTGEQTIDGVLTSASRVLVKDQTSQSQNGVYVSAAGAWSRATDADTWGEIYQQAVSVTGGTVNIRRNYGNTNEAGGTIGVDNITWTQLLFYPVDNSVSTASLQDNAVTNAKLAQLATQTIKGRASAGTGGAEDLSALNATSILSPYYYGDRNIIRNSGFTMFQRNTTLTVLNGVGQYSADGWYALPTGANLTVQQYPLLGENVYYALLLTGNTSMTDTRIIHKIESLTAQKVAGQRTTVRFRLFNATGASITPQFSIRHAGAKDDWSSPVADVSSASFAAVPNSTAAVCSYTFDASVNSGNGLELTLQFGASLNANTKAVYISAIDMRATPEVAATGINTNPHTAEIPNPAVEREWCLRFLEGSFDNLVAAVDNAGVNTGTGFIATKAAALVNRWFIPFKVTKFKIPAVTLYNPSSGTAAQAYDAIAAGSFSSCSAEVVNMQGWRFAGTGNASTAIGNICGIGWLASAEI